MFSMTHEIIVKEVNGGKPFKANSMKWAKSIYNVADSAMVRVPAITRLNKNGDSYERVQTGILFKEGMEIEIYAGYDGQNDRVFKGFISRINFTIPIEIECEGFSYQLRKKNFSKSYAKNWKLKQLLQDLIEGTDIKLSRLIPDVTINTAMRFKNYRGNDVLEWIKEKGLQTVYFNEDELYCGLQQGLLKGEAKYRLEWNVIKDSDLKFSIEKEFATVKIELKQPRKKNGAVRTAVKDSKFTDTYVKKIAMDFDDAYVDRIAAEEKRKLSNRGYEGSITTFLKPFATPGMTAVISSGKYPERAGRYFIPAVEGEFRQSGGRQEVKISNAM